MYLKKKKKLQKSEVTFTSTGVLAMKVRSPKK